ncbi:hypothetical protein MB02_13940 [Croceicoccus estronivorus]|uniref:hypothetical protein n=1 Tax=Croceicoccus estronivorus TaxID=1172626 RepID=UPI00082E13A5|nr:hypothetical protein [Croceicoccus estronivorus]OCC22874.1 hypothetical protein MB02_13940 [Croceicoccus estronivorus]
MNFRTTPFVPAVLLGTALLACSVAAGASEPLTPAQQFKLRCAAAFAQVAAGQARGDAALADYPPLAERGREYFVRASAQVMNAAGMTREELQSALQEQAAALAEPGRLDAMMPACLASLEASGL